MKKIVGIVAAASMVAGLAFADGPAANVAITDFTGSASVQWGVDLDSGTTGFKNSESLKFVVNLFDAGTKSTSSDNDVWAELVLKAGNTRNWTHRLFQVDWTGGNTKEFTEVNNSGANTGYAGAITGSEISLNIDTAKIHFGDFYVGIKGGDTKTGQYKVDSAIRGYDHWKGQGQWLNDVGPDKYSQGIVAGYDNSNFGIGVDFRSNPDTDNQYTSNYAFAAEAQLKDSNEFAEGLFVDVGGSMNLTKNKYVRTANTALKVNEAVENKFNVTTLGYSASAGYKFKIDDKYWFKPTVAFTGSNVTTTRTNSDYKKVVSDGYVVAGAMLGWGSAQDAEGGVYYFDNPNNASRKVCGGVSVVAGIPLDTTTTVTGSATSTSNGIAKALIMPSFYTKGDLVEGLTAAAYSEIALLRGEKSTDANKTWAVAKDKDDTFALALAAAVAYDIKADDVTVTPQVGFRFANTAYADNDVSSLFKHGDNDPAFFTGLGAQKKVADAASKRNGLYENGFFNLKAGVNVNGLINNTDIFAEYESANLLNGEDYSKYKNADGTAKKFYNVKLGTFNVGCKISL